MKRSCHLILCSVVIASLLCSIIETRASTSTNSDGSSSLSELISNNMKHVSQFTNEADIERSYHAGLISKDNALIASLLIKNRDSQDIYGRVMDQSGQPVSYAKIQGNLVLNVDASGTADELHFTETDADGRFQFIGLHGAGLGIWPQKSGYDYNLKLPSKRPENYLPDSNVPVVFTMWKLKGPEPMVHCVAHSLVPCDGGIVRFNLLTGKPDPSGDLTVSLVRDPLQIDRHHHFNWTLAIGITNGGFHEITDLYPNEAPSEGYQQTIKFDFPTNMVNWLPKFNNSYYFKSKKDQIYGHITFNIYANYQPPPTYFGVDIYANPAGSRNLEFDHKKQIR